MSARQPAEWAPHQAVWIGFPSDASLWLEDLGPAQAEVAAFARAVHDGGRGEQVILVAADPAARAAAELAVESSAIQVAEIPFGDIWLRDTGPLFLDDGSAAAFLFNGWGGKYQLDHDDKVAGRIIDRVGCTFRQHDWVLEGGAIDVDGRGAALTTEQCLLNPNRNPAMDRAEIEARLAADLGLDRIVWLGEGLAGDHTDGHVDNLARFVGEGIVALPEATSTGDPNAAVYADAAGRLEAAGLEIRPIPSPGLVEVDGEAIPASYMNFYVGNTVVAVPIYGVANDGAAVAAIGALFPGRRAIGLPANHILTGGGSFHCISQQQPSRA